MQNTVCCCVEELVEKAEQNTKECSNSTNITSHQVDSESNKKGEMTIQTSRYVLGGNSHPKIIELVNGNECEATFFTSYFLVNPNTKKQIPTAAMKSMSQMLAFRSVDATFLFAAAKGNSARQSNHSAVL